MKPKSQKPDIHHSGKPKPKTHAKAGHPLFCEISQKLGPPLSQKPDIHFSDLQPKAGHPPFRKAQAQKAQKAQKPEIHFSARSAKSWTSTL